MSEQYTETFDEFLDRYPDLVFIRTKKQIFTGAEVDENIIYEDDTLPLVKGKSLIIPIDETAYPRCLEYGTAMELGIWAVYICEKNNWEINPPRVWEILKNQEAVLAEEADKDII